MNKLRSSLQNKTFALVLLLIGVQAIPARSTDGNQPAGGSNVMVKDLLSSSGGGAPAQGSGYSLDFSLGEPAAGPSMGNSTWTLTSGYLAVRLGVGQTLRVIRSQIGNAPYFYQNGIQVGTTDQAVIQINFSDPLDAASLPSGISVDELENHLGQSMNTKTPFNLTYDPAGSLLRLSPQQTWKGNTLYNVVLNKNLLSQDGYALDASTSIPFRTALDPLQENIVTSQFNLSVLMANTPASRIAAGGANLTLDIPQGALSDYAMVILNPDPLNNPLKVDPSIIQEANQKARNAGGSYRSPVALGEIAAYNLHGQPLASLSTPAQASLTYSQSNGLLSGPSVPVRASTLSMWVLDQSHQLWVKIPASIPHPAANTVVAPITQFSVFALMGGSDGSASDVYVFPNPWRPHGPTAGTGSGQTGTEAGGMTFNNLPSECTIRIYTLSQEGVRTLHHSDAGGTIGQERWDGQTSGGAHAASGVYLWRVESNVDSKNGKLIIIR